MQLALERDVLEEMLERQLLRGAGFEKVLGSFALYALGPQRLALLRRHLTLPIGQ